MSRYYYEPGRLSPAHVLELYTASTRKPIVIGEVGTNGNTSGGGNPPHASDDAQRAVYLRKMGMHAARGDIAGILVWKLTDTTSTHWFGLFDSANNPTTQIAEVVKWPSQRVDHVQAAIDYADIPIVFDDFSRAPGPIGAPSIGAPASFELGTWSIGSTPGVDERYAKRTGDFGGAMQMSRRAYESRSTNALVEAEFKIPDEGEVSVGVIFRAADSSNFHLWRYRRSTGLALFQANGGGLTNVTPANLWEGSTSTGTEITGFSPRGVIRLGVRGWGSQIYCYYFDRIFRITLNNHLNATQHGIAIADVDTGSVVSKVLISAPRRVF